MTAKRPKRYKYLVTMHCGKGLDMRVISTESATPKEAYQAILENGGLEIGRRFVPAHAVISVEAESLRHVCLNTPETDWIHSWEERIML